MTSMTCKWQVGSQEAAPTGGRWHCSPVNEQTHPTLHQPSRSLRIKRFWISLSRRGKIARNWLVRRWDEGAEICNLIELARDENFQKYGYYTRGIH